MGRHGWFIFFSYAVTATAIGGIIVWVLADYKRLRNALKKFPPREGDERD